MLRRERQLFVQTQRLLDAGLLALAFWLAHRLREQGLFEVVAPRPEILPFATYAWMLLILVPLGPLLLQIQGFYSRPWVSSRRQSFWHIVSGTSWVTLALVVASFLAREQPARGVIVVFAGVAPALLLLKEEIVQVWVRSTLGQSHFQRRLIVVGTEEDRRVLRDRLRQSGRGGLEILAELDLNETPVEQLLVLIHQHSPNGVLLSARHTFFGRVEKVIAACELEGVEVWLMADFFKTQISQTVLDEFHGLPMLVFRSTPEASWQVMAKQVLDFTGATLILLVASIPMLLSAIAIRLTSRGPIFFRQQRCGLNGRPFTMLKFRSMVTDAEQRKHELEKLNEMTGPVFKVTNDPRVTSVGRLLRKYSIDEFPQLINVLRGEMSLVGPRPLPVDEVARFDDLAHRRRLSVKPGITCLWQVSGRNNVTDFKEWVRLDLEYIDNWSLWLDLRILARTVPVVLLGTGAK